MGGRALKVYERPLLYDLAFAYRDFSAEAEALAAFFERHARGTRLRAVLEVAAGPASHAIEFAKRGARTFALDVSEAMCAYAGGKAALVGTPLEVRCADMRAFDLGETFDLALCMNHSVAHLHDADAMGAHLEAMARHLRPGGLYVVEAQHPRHFVGRGPRPRDALQPWNAEGMGLRLRVQWGASDDPYDPLRQLFFATVRFEVGEGEEVQLIEERCVMRDWGLPELRAAMEGSGAFEIAGLYGDFDPEVPLSDSPKSWRMILVLRRR